MRTPIEMMVDRACGFDRAAVLKVDQEHEVAALLAVADAAVVWLAAKRTRSEDLRLDAEATLMKAAVALEGLGWLPGEGRAR